MRQFYLGFRKEKGIKKIITNGYLFFIGLPILGKRLRFHYALKLLKDCSSKKKVLDTGCTIGDFAITLLKKGVKKVDGVDITPDRIAFCLKYAKSQKLNFNYRNNDVTTLSSPKSYYDMITGLDILEHIKDDKIVLKNFNEMLKDKGEVVLSFPSIFRKVVPKHEKAVGHVRKGYSVKTIEKKLEQAGFILQDQIYADTFDFMYLFYKFEAEWIHAVIFPILYPLTLITTSLFPKRGSILCVKAIKK